MPKNRFDSGYTRHDIEMMLDDLIDAATEARLGIDARSIVTRALGFDGDLVALSPTDTALIEEPCSTLDARLDAVCSFIGQGLSLIDALEALPKQLRRAA